MREHLATLLDDFKTHKHEIAIVRFQGVRRRVRCRRERQREHKQKRDSQRRNDHNLLPRKFSGITSKIATTSEMRFPQPTT